MALFGKTKGGDFYPKDQGHVPHQRPQPAGHGTPKIISPPKEKIKAAASFLFGSNRKFSENKRNDAFQNRQKEARRIIDENNELLETKPTMSKEEIEQLRRTKESANEKEQSFNLFEGGGKFAKPAEPVGSAPQSVNQDAPTEPEPEKIVGRAQGIPVSSLGYYYMPDNEKMRILDNNGSPVNDLEQAKRILQDMEIAKAQANKEKINSDELRAEEQVMESSRSSSSSGRSSGGGKKSGGKGLDADLLREEISKTASGEEFLGE